MIMITSISYIFHAIFVDKYRPEMIFNQTGVVSAKVDVVKQMCGGPPPS